MLSVLNFPAARDYAEQVQKLRTAFQNQDVRNDLGFPEKSQQLRIVGSKRLPDLKTEELVRDSDNLLNPVFPATPFQFLNPQARLNAQRKLADFTAELLTDQGPRLYSEKLFQRVNENLGVVSEGPKTIGIRDTLILVGHSPLKDHPEIISPFYVTPIVSSVQEKNHYSFKMDTKHVAAHGFGVKLKPVSSAHSKTVYTQGDEIPITWTVSLNEGTPVPDNMRLNPFEKVVMTQKSQPLNLLTLEPESAKH